MSDLEDYDAKLAALDEEQRDAEEGDEQEPYDRVHCGTCHGDLNGVGGKAHKPACPQYDGHKMMDCPHPVEKWRKSHHKREVQFLRKREAAREGQAQG